MGRHVCFRSVLYNHITVLYFLLMHLTQFIYISVVKQPFETELSSYILSYEIYFLVFIKVDRT